MDLEELVSLPESSGIALKLAHLLPQARGKE